MIDFSKRLTRLKNRRQGTRELDLLKNNKSIYDSNDYRERENYEQLSEKDSVRYAIGSMAAVSHESTNISIREGERVADNLISRLKNHGVITTKRLQGSVALDIHIKGHSDVDMLILKDDIVLVETPKLNGNNTQCSDQRPMVDIVAEIRNLSEIFLPSSFPAAKVDCTGSKSIALEGGSLQRKVDIVPSCWHDTHEYQRTYSEQNRAIKIYDKSEHKLIGNKPFKHIHLINERDTIYNGNLKRVIRLMKNLVADMPDYKKVKAKKLSSYDLAAIGYHMNNDLFVPEYMTLGLVDNCRSFLEALQNSPAFRSQLLVPDGSRCIFDDQSKDEALDIISKEISDLAHSIFTELQPYSTTYSRDIIKSKAVYI